MDLPAPSSEACEHVVRNSDELYRKPDAAAPPAQKNDRFRATAQEPSDFRSGAAAQQPLKQEALLQREHLRTHAPPVRCGALPDMTPQLCDSLIIMRAC
jgi:hypothetical protein